MFHTKKRVLPTQGHPRGIITCYFVAPEIRHIIFYGPKNHVSRKKLNGFTTKQIWYITPLSAYLNVCMRYGFMANPKIAKRFK